MSDPIWQMVKTHPKLIMHFKRRHIENIFRAHAAPVLFAHAGDIVHLERINATLTIEHTVVDVQHHHFTNDQVSCSACFACFYHLIYLALETHIALSHSWWLDFHRWH